MAEEWFYAQQGEQKGPVSSSDLKKLAASRQLQPSDLIWKEGLTQWVSAGTVKGLFPPEQMQTRAPAPSPATSSPGPANDVETFEYNEDEERPRRSRRARDFDEDDEDEDLEDRPRRRRRRRAESGGSGLKVFLIIGGIVLVLAILGCGGIFAIIWMSDEKSGNSTYTFSLNADQNIAIVGNPMRARADSRNERRVRFLVGQTVEVRVSNSNPNADVDLYIMDARGLIVSQDIAEANNCFVSFRANHTEDYRIIVQNLGPQNARCTVTYTTK